MFDRKYWRPDWDDRHMPPEDRAEKNRWWRLYSAIERAIPAGRPSPPFEHLSDEQIFMIARKYTVDPAAFGFEV